MEAIFRRVSVRKFRDQQVEEEKIEKLMRAAMAAPTGGNQKPWEFYVVTDKEKLMQLSETSRYSVFTKDAPVAIVPCCRTEQLVYPELKEVDMSLAAENILLEAVDLDLGGVFLAVYPYEDRMRHVEKVLDVPEGLRAFALLLIGYPFQERVRKDTFDPSRVHKV